MMPTSRYVVNGRLAALHRRWLDDDGTLRERDDAAAMRRAEPGWRKPAVPRW
ncbi:MAG TPA: hypothetical protein VIS29_21200 [Streptomyces sp.]